MEIESKKGRKPRRRHQAQDHCSVLDALFSLLVTQAQGCVAPYWVPTECVPQNPHFTFEAGDLT